MRKVSVLFVIATLTCPLFACEEDRGPRISYRRDSSQMMMPQLRDDGGSEDAMVDGGANDATIDAQLDAALDASIPGSVSLPSTGQRTCFTVAGDELECIGTGQDGELQSGEPWPTPRFTAGSGTVVDALTGLEWLADGNCIATKYPNFDDQDTQSELKDGIVNWPHAIDFAKGVRDGTYDGCTQEKDWRLPNINELLSLVHAGRADTAAWLGEQGFSNVNAGLYWTSTPSAGSSLDAWLVRMTNGEAALAWKSQDYAAVLLVRGVTTGAVQATGIQSCTDGAGFLVECADTGQDGEYQTGVPSPDLRFTDNDDGTTTDALTGLMWLTDGTCVSNYPAAETNGSVNNRLTWNEALEFVDGVNVGTYSNCAATHEDWRLPNLNELRSIMNYGSRPAHTILESVSGVDVELWTSTTATAETDNAWFVRVWDGSTGFGIKTDERQLVLVRDAP